MAYNQQLADRVRGHALPKDGVSEMKMFGGLAFMVRTNMFCGVVHDDLMVRVGPEGHEAALAKPGARPMDFSGRPMRGMLFVGPAGYDDETALSAWIEQCYAFASTLPEKRPRKSRR